MTNIEQLLQIQTVCVADAENNTVFTPTAAGEFLRKLLARVAVLSNILERTLAEVAELRAEIDELRKMMGLIP